MKSALQIVLLATYLGAGSIQPYSLRSSRVRDYYF